MPMKNKLSASEPSNSQRGPRRVRAGARLRFAHGRTPGNGSGSNTVAGRSVLAAATDWPSMLAVEAGDADGESEQRAAGERGHARPGRRELPVEQHRRQSPERLLLARQWAGQSRRKAGERGVVDLYGLSMTDQRGIEPARFLEQVAGVGVACDQPFDRGALVRRPARRIGTVAVEKGLQQLDVHHASPRRSGSLGRGAGSACRASAKSPPPKRWYRVSRPPAHCSAPRCR